MIEFHEDEYLQSPVEDSVLLAVLLLFGQEAKDKLLYEGDADDRNTGSPASLPVRGVDMANGHSDSSSDSQAPGRPA